MKEISNNCWQVFGTVNLSMSQLPITREHLVKSQWSIFTFEYAEEFRLTCSLILVLPAVRAALFKFIARSRGTTLRKITIAADANKGKYFVSKHLRLRKDLSSSACSCKTGGSILPGREEGIKQGDY